MSAILQERTEAQVFSGERGIEEELATQLRTACPNILFSEFIWTGERDMHFVIDDVSLEIDESSTREDIRRFQEVASQDNSGIHVLDLVDLTDHMVMLISPFLDKVDPATTLLLFPGSGARSVRKALPEEILARFPTCNVEAKRVKDPQTNKAVGIETPHIQEEIAKMREAIPSIETVIVFDDVVDSGQTLLTVQERADLPNAVWVAATPILFSPLPYGRIESPSSLPTFTALVATTVLQGKQNPVDLNSLTSFIEGGKKTDRLVKKCLERYVQLEGQSDFLQVLQALRMQVYGD